MRTSLGVALAGAALVAGPLALPAAAAPAAASPGPTTVVSGLAGPLHVSYDHAEDALYVADAFTGTIYRADPETGEKTKVPGGKFADGTFVGSVDGAPDGGLYVVLTRPGDGGQAPTALVHISASGKKEVVANLLRYERAHNPDRQPLDTPDTQSNPYDVLAVRGGALVADAAGNDVLFVSDSGKVRTLTVLPVSRSGDCADVENNGVAGGGCDPVPTDLAMGADGFLYVSGLGAEVEGFIWKVDPADGRIVQTWRGLPPLTGVAVDRSGNLYGSSLFAGSIIRITPDGDRSGIAVPGPTGLALHDGRLYAGSLDLSGASPSTVQELGVWAF